MMATTEFVVPRSMPTILPIAFSFAFETHGKDREDLEVQGGRGFLPRQYATGEGSHAARCL
jgi:hypothetical protein